MEEDYGHWKKNVFFCQNSEKQKMAPLFQYLLIFLVSIGRLHGRTIFSSRKLEESSII